MTARHRPVDPLRDWDARADGYSPADVEADAAAAPSLTAERRDRIAALLRAPAVKQPRRSA